MSRPFSFGAKKRVPLTVAQRPGRFGAADSPSEDSHRQGQQQGREEKEHGDGMPKGNEACAGEKSGASGVQRVGDGVEARDDLEPVWKDRNGEERTADDARDAKNKPLRRVPSLENEEIAGGKNAQAGEGEQRRKEHDENGKPVGRTQGKAEKRCGP